MSGYGPWSPGLSDTERIARLRSIATAVAGVLRDGPARRDLIATLRAAEGSLEALESARAALEALPSIPYRLVISVCQAAHRPRADA